ncbi:hypothetical protein EJ08DRAFT_720747 [Tothia fuscella]|uniref:Uncharacterized protein n=1 Tax=Tothia fuscella TaxID=1048955 RepID=A0A9P4NMR9_9PEZI|nr:hypothetical protein EJ08DRAFT_720747 [Tothia fuscella]
MPRQKMYLLDPTPKPLPLLLSDLTQATTDLTLANEDLALAHHFEHLFQTSFSASTIENMRPIYDAAMHNSGNWIWEAENTVRVLVERVATIWGLVVEAGGLVEEMNRGMGMGMGMDVGMGVGMNARNVGMGKGQGDGVAMGMEEGVVDPDETEDERVEAVETNGMEEDSDDDQGSWKGWDDIGVEEEPETEPENTLRTQGLFQNTTPSTATAPQHSQSRTINTAFISHDDKFQEYNDKLEEAKFEIQLAETALKDYEKKVKEQKDDKYAELYEKEAKYFERLRDEAQEKKERLERKIRDVD